MPSRPVLLAFAVVLCALAGCGEPEGIRVVEEPKPAPPAPPDVPADQKKFRTIAAMIPQNGGEPGNERGEWWFFKFTGPADIVQNHKPAFDAIINSVRLTGEKHDPITWTLPPKWIRVDDDDKKVRFATLKYENKDSPVEITVTKFGGMLLMNVNRWRKQLGLEEVTGLQLVSATTMREINGRLVILVDMAGPKEPPKGGPMVPGQ